MLWIFVILGVLCYLIGFFIGFVFGNVDRVKKERVEKCETIEDIIKREG